MTTAVDPGTEVFERPQKRRHRSRVRLLVAVKSHGAVGECGNRGNEAHDRTGKAAVDGSAGDKGLGRGDFPPIAFLEDLTPRARSASRISWVSRASRPPVITDGPLAKAARISARLVSDLEPGIATVAVMGAAPRAPPIVVVQTPLRS